MTAMWTRAYVVALSLLLLLLLLLLSLETDTDPAFAAGVSASRSLCAVPFLPSFLPFLQAAHQAGGPQREGGGAGQDAREAAAADDPGTGAAPVVGDGVGIGLHAEILPGVLAGGAGLVVVGRAVVQRPDLPVDPAPAVHHVEDAPAPGRRVEAAAIPLPPVQRDHLVAVHRRGGEQREIGGLVPGGLHNRIRRERQQQQR